MLAPIEPAYAVAITARRVRARCSAAEPGPAANRRTRLRRASGSAGAGRSPFQPAASDSRTGELVEASDVGSQELGDQGESTAPSSHLLLDHWFPVALDWNEVTGP